MPDTADLPDHPDLGLAYRFQPAEEGAGPTITLLLLHDGGGDEASLLPVGQAVAPGTALLAPRLPAAEDRHQLAQELAAFVGRAEEALDLGTEGIWGLGFGDGATALTALVADHPTLLEGGVVLSGRAPFEPPKGRFLEGMKVFCATATEDPGLSDADFEQLVELLVTGGAEAELHWYDCGHELGDDQLADVRRWLERWAVGPVRTPSTE